MKKLLFTIVVSLLYLACTAQVTITKEDGSVIEGTSLKLKKGILNYGTGTIPMNEVLFLKYKNKYLCQEGKKNLGMLKKGFNPDINDKNAMAQVMAHKFYKCKCNPSELSVVYKKYASDEAFLATMKNEQNRMVNMKALGIAGGVVCGVLVFVLVNVAVAAAM